MINKWDLLKKYIKKQIEEYQYDYEFDNNAWELNYVEAFTEVLGKMEDLSSQEYKQTFNKSTIAMLEYLRDDIEDILERALNNCSINQKYYDEILDLLDEKIEKEDK